MNKKFPNLKLNKFDRFDKSLKQAIGIFKSIKPNSAAELQSLKVFLSQFNDPITAAKKGRISPFEYFTSNDFKNMPERNKIFSKWFNSKISNKFKIISSLPSPVAGKTFGDITLGDKNIEDVRQAIIAGQYLGYSPEDIARYVIKNYVPGGWEAEEINFKGNLNKLLKALRLIL
jgi:hypothetical protein